MKKLVVLLLTLVLALSCLSVNVFAAGLSADAQKIIDTLSAPVQFNGSDKSVTIPAVYLAQAENYLQTANLTSSQYAGIYNQIENAISVIKSQNPNVAPNGVVNLQIVPRSAKTAIINDAIAAASIANLDLTYGDYYINVTEKGSSNPVITIGGTTTPTGSGPSSIIKATGIPNIPSIPTVTIALISVLAIFLAFIISLSYKFRLFSKVELINEN